ncbi:MAG: hypothetical protein FWB76_06825 [Oscillospiraceae bacterium]|nr:hypothetical protein [Oscillospiraceae bacterium]
MKKSTIAVIAIIAALAVAVAVLFALNWNAIQDRQQLLADGELHLTHAGDVFVLTVADIEALNPQPLDAILRGGGQPGVDVTFYAVPFRDIMDAFIPLQDDVDYTVLFSAADGFATAMPQSEAMQAAYIALCADRGPFRLILPGDHFAQRWVHWLTGIELR